MKILELKCIITEMKNSLEILNNRFYLSEKKIKKLKDKSIGLHNLKNKENEENLTPSEKCETSLNTPTYT